MLKRNHTEATEESLNLDYLFPECGYVAVQNYILKALVNNSQKNILNLSVGKSYPLDQFKRAGCHIITYNLANGYNSDALYDTLPNGAETTLDGIIAIYSFQNISIKDRIAVLQDCMPLLQPSGSIYIGDTIYKDITQAHKGRRDNEYVSFAGLQNYFPHSNFRKLAADDGVIIIRPHYRIC